MVISSSLFSFFYLLSGVLFILSLHGLSHPSTSRRGNYLGVLGMVIAVGTTFSLLLLGGGVTFSTFALSVLGLGLGGGVGVFVARRIAMTAMPQLVAAFHSLVGLAAVFVAAAAFSSPENFGILGQSGISAATLLEMSLGLAIGALTFTGSLVAFAKLQGLVSGAPLVFRGQHVLNLLLGGVIVFGIVGFMLSGKGNFFVLISVVAFLLGFLLILPIGGADMPVVVSMLNSYSGWAAAGIGFTLHNMALIITGALVGSSGAILSYIMCKGMNRSFISVILGGFGAEACVSSSGADQEARPVKVGSAEDAAFLLKNCGSLIIVPGYGMAVAQAQHALREMADLLKESGVQVRYAIHPVAGRMPGHMNVLLAEAQISYDDVFELEDINGEFGTTDVVLVIGANDVTNPAAREDPQSPIYGMPVLEVWKAGTVMFIKRSLASGYAGIDNALFYRENTMMLLGDGKKMVEHISKALPGV